MTQRERPILFSAPMVRALLAGTKTQTRRVVKPQPDVAQAGRITDTGLCGRFTPDDERLGRLAKNIACPYGVPGERLWVREAFRFPSSLDKLSPVAVGDKALDAGYSAPWCPTQYEADNARTGTWSSFHTPPTDTLPGRPRAGMHMPRWASRITLEVTDVRVERLQDISEADAIAEGCHGPDDDDASNLPDCRQCGGTGLFTAFNEATGGALPDTDCTMCDTPAKRYRLLWESINGPGSWDANPWVWCVSFKRAAA